MCVSLRFSFRSVPLSLSPRLLGNINHESERGALSTFDKERETKWVVRAGEGEEVGRKT